jgi:tRNA-specific 2-thiouridylase
MTPSTRVVVAMSGGVDSSVAAALLVQQGYDVIGIMLRLWSEPGSEADNRCCTPDAMATAKRVANQLNIPFYPLNAEEMFYGTVVRHFIDGYAQGITPNPCLVCNRFVRWGFLLQKAQSLGADYLATGHYARLGQQNGEYQLLRAKDEAKDQSYVLYSLTQEQLAHTLFPLGDYTKQQVREIASQLQLPAAQRPESQDLCFLGSKTYGEFLAQYAPQVVNPGPILSPQGEVLGQHAGLAFYTIGQRKGLGISAPQPLYVLEKDVERNTLIVGEKDELGKDELIAGQVNWIASRPPTEPFRAQVKIRYKAKLAQAAVHPLPKNRVRVTFDAPLRDITPGQAAVFYQNDRCLGGGLIQGAGQ